VAPRLRGSSTCTVMYIYIYVCVCVYTGTRMGMNLRIQVAYSTRVVLRVRVQHSTVHNTRAVCVLERMGRCCIKIIVHCNCRKRNRKNEQPGESRWAHGRGAMEVVSGGRFPKSIYPPKSGKEGAFWVSGLRCGAVIGKAGA
jgi:hypothetical protein